jgi:hypothetical protein
MELSAGMLGAALAWHRPGAMDNDCRRKAGTDMPHRLMTLLIDVVACLVVVAAVGGCGTPVTPEQKAAIDLVQDLGGKVNFERGGYLIDLRGTQVEDKDLESLKDFEGLRELNLTGTRITDKALPYLQASETLKIARLQRTLITPAGVKKLRKAKPDLQVDY